MFFQATLVDRWPITRFQLTLVNPYYPSLSSSKLLPFLTITLHHQLTILNPRFRNHNLDPPLRSSRHQVVLPSYCLHWCFRPTEAIRDDRITVVNRRQWPTISWIVVTIAGQCLVTSTSSGIPILYSLENPHTAKQQYEANKNQPPNYLLASTTINQDGWAGWTVELIDLTKLKLIGRWMNQHTRQHTAWLPSGHSANLQSSQAQVEHKTASGASDAGDLGLSCEHVELW